MTTKVQSEFIADSSVTTAKLADDAVTTAKLGNITTISNSSGDITLDASGDIILDADGDDIKFAEGGTVVMEIKHENTGVNFHLNATDEDYKFRGSAAGTTITALQLDMSEAGKAIFNGGASFGSDVSIVSTGNGLSLSRSGYDTYALQHSTGNGMAIYNVSDSRNEMFFDGAGKVGIGTTSPATTLDIRTTNGSDAKLRLGSSSSIGLDVLGTIEFFSADVDDSGIKASIHNLSTGNQGPGGSLSGNLIFSTTASDGGGNDSPTERMRIDASGNLFLNTTSAMDNCFVSFRDHSNGEAFLGIEAKDDNNVGIRLGHGGTRKWVMYSDPSDNLIWYSNAASAERIRIASDGHIYIDNQIGVGVLDTMTSNSHNWQSNVYNTLSVGGMALGTDSSNTSHMWFNMYDTGSKYSVDSGYAMDHYHANGSGDYVWRQFSHAGSAGASITPTQVFKMDRNGKIGYQKVDPSGDMTIHTGGANGTSTKWRWGSNVSNTHSYWINHNNAGVYMTSGSTSWSAHSDERIKENITDIGLVMDKIKDYRCVTYNRKGMSDTKVGFIAQDWETDFPHVVDEDSAFTIQDDGSLMAVHEEENTSELKAKSISYTETIPILLKAIQELEARIKVLEG